MIGQGCGSNSFLWLAVLRSPPLRVSRDCDVALVLHCSCEHAQRALWIPLPLLPLSWGKTNIIAHTIINGKNGKFVILRYDKKNSSQNAQYNFEKIQQKCQVKNLPNMVWVRNSRNCMRPVEQQEALVIQRRILNDNDNCCISTGTTRKSYK